MKKLALIFMYLLITALPVCLFIDMRQTSLSRYAKMDARIDAVTARLDNIDLRIDELQDQVDAIPDATQLCRDVIFEIKLLRGDLASWRIPIEDYYDVINRQYKKEH